MHFIWAVILACHAAASSFAPLVVLRVLLGAFESTISPGFSLVTSMWYVPLEHASRHALWASGNSVGTILGGLMAYGIAHITSGPLEPWRWIFIILGVLTFIWSILLLWFLPDSPLTAGFLTPEERQLAHLRPQFFKQSEAPGYKTGFNPLLVTSCLCVGLIGVYGFYCAWENQRRDAKYGKPDGSRSVPETEENTLKDGTDWDQAATFRYSY
ncbi:major facilitator superfamily domain-containing protein [Aspergillus coremiiformis]|uniref:Major facilitator superfamily domain-containing protein n=1 Tax=Aspergillus coremiiformis TaxID=138285 RepID=A0A5N6ZAY8_9EURO|nr:major facilitator superfamily domain-containing protein [Aspergillus coremiiformis]